MENSQNEPGFKMIMEDGNSLAIQRVYPKHLSEKEIADAEKNAPTVILHCFDPVKVENLRLLGEEISRNYNAAHALPAAKEPAVIRIGLKRKFR